MKAPYHYAYNEPSTIIRVSFYAEVCIKICFCPQMPEYGNSAPDPENFENSKTFATTECIWLLHFTQVLNSYFKPRYSIPKNVFWSQIPKYGNSAPDSKK